MGQEILTGFGHSAVLGVADKVITAVQAGQFRHFFLIGGCDAKTGRNYYTEFAEKTPKDTVILTLASATSAESPLFSRWASATTPTWPSRSLLLWPALQVRDQ